MRPKLHNKNFAHASHFVVFCSRLVWNNFIPIFRLTSLALGQSNDCFQAYFTGTGAIKWLFLDLLHWHWGNQMIVFRLTSLALGQSNDCFQAYFTGTGAIKWLFSGLLHWHWGNQMIVFRLTSLALGQSNDCFQACFTGTGAIKWLFSGLLHWQSNDCFQAYFTGTGAIKWLFSGLLHWHWGNQVIVFRLTSLALGQSNDCPSASKVTLKNIARESTKLYHAISDSKDHKIDFDKTPIPYKGVVLMSAWSIYQGICYCNVLMQVLATRGFPIFECSSKRGKVIAFCHNDSLLSHKGT